MRKNHKTSDVKDYVKGSPRFVRGDVVSAYPWYGATLKRVAIVISCSVDHIVLQWSNGERTQVYFGLYGGVFY